MARDDGSGVPRGITPVEVQRGRVVRRAGRSYREQSHEQVSPNGCDVGDASAMTSDDATDRLDRIEKQLDEALSMLKDERDESDWKIVFQLSVAITVPLVMAVKFGSDLGWGEAVGMGVGMAAAFGFAWGAIAFVFDVFRKFKQR